MNRNTTTTFTNRDVRLFLASGVLVTGGYLCMIADPAPNGFGTLTLTISPLLLVAGFLLPIAGIIGTDHLKSVLRSGNIRSGWQKHLAGLSVFGIALTTYTLTLEPTASLWDCGEFIASAYKLQVPHTPGTPLTLLVGRLFTMLAFGNVQQVAWCMNLMSAFFSAMSVLIVYHIIFTFSQRIEKTGTTISILAGICGSLCLTFSDTFWFSAVEAETYGIACFFLLLILFLIIRGKNFAEPLRSRYLVLIAYLTSLSYCIHPMCVLVLPVLPIFWFTNNRNVSIKTLVLSVLAGLLIVFAINKFIAIGLFELAFNVDLFFVNTLNLPFYSGAVVLLVIIVAAFFWLIHKVKRYRTYTWSVVFLLLGFLPYLMLFIRSNHNPPIDETNPEDLAMIKAYMNRESYPSSPLLTGPYFDAQITEAANSRKAYYKATAEYKVAGSLVNYSYEKNRTTILPRMYSRDPDHINAYRQWTGLKPGEKPTFKDNLYFMFRYQLGHMYLRYLLWNFAGRESDVQNSAWLKPWQSQATAHDSKARNQYWMIPLILGLCGAFIQYKADKKSFYGNAIFFLMTGLVLALYLNSPPIEPRERDYIYVASYIAFCIWAGIGILIFKQSFLPGKVQYMLFVVVTMAVPSWMLYQNLDDHDRSSRTFQMDYARQVLNSCAPDAILFTGGDNDTFPLWYLQEVEGLRTDVRIVVLSYFNTDWYINQLRNQYYDSKPFKLTLREEDYRQYGLNDVLYVEDRIKNPIDVKRFLQLLKDEHAALRRYTNKGDSYHIVPSYHLKIIIDQKQSSAFKRAGVTKPAELNLMITDNFLQKNALAVLDLITSDNGQRPVYFNFTSMNTVGMDIHKYLVDEGLLYRLTANENSASHVPIDTEKAYRNLVTNGNYANLRRKDVFFNHEDYHLRMITPLKQDFNILAAAYIEEGDSAMAKNVLTKSFDCLLQPHLPTAYIDIYTAGLLRALGEEEKAKAIAIRYFNRNFHEVAQQVEERKQPDRDDLYFLTQAAQLLKEMGEFQYAEEVSTLYR